LAQAVRFARRNKLISESGEPRNWPPAKKTGRQKAALGRVHAFAICHNARRSDIQHFSLETFWLKERCGDVRKLNSATERLRSMPAPRVLIVEDEPMVAMDLESTVTDVIAAEIVIAPSVSSARDAMAEPLDFAFLDIEVTDGKTFEIALELQRNGVSFVFVSGARPEALPPDLRGAPFIPKPFDRHLIARVLRRHARARCSLA
jgi:hypothetical protein